VDEIETLAYQFILLLAELDTSSIEVLLVDDHYVVHSGLATFLRAHEDLELVGEE